MISIYERKYYYIHAPMIKNFINLMNEIGEWDKERLEWRVPADSVTLDQLKEKLTKAIGDDAIKVY